MRQCIVNVQRFGYAHLFSVACSETGAAVGHVCARASTAETNRHLWEIGEPMPAGKQVALKTTAAIGMVYTKYVRPIRVLTHPRSLPLRICQTAHQHQGRAHLCSVCLDPGSLPERAHGSTFNVPHLCWRFYSRRLSLMASRTWTAQCSRSSPCQTFFVPGSD